MISMPVLYVPAVYAQAGSKLQGWTTVGLAGSNKRIFVSNDTGDDANDGLTEGTPKQTIDGGSGATSIANPGDHILLRRGETWTDQRFNINNIGGAGPNAWMLVGTYGDEANGRAIVSMNGGTTGNGIGVPLNGGSWSGYIAMQGIDLRCVTNTQTNTGIRTTGARTGLLIEDCAISGFETGISTGSGMDEITIRRCSIYDNWNSAADGHGMFIGDGCDDILIEGVFFYRNGWNPTFLNTYDERNRNAYFHSGATNIVWRENISMESASDGYQARAGGIVENSLFVKNHAASFNWGYVVGGSSPTSGGVTGAIRGNVCLEPDRFNDNRARGGILVGNVSSLTMEDNVLSTFLPAIDEFSSAGRGYMFRGDIPNEVDIGINNVTFRRNVAYNFPRALSLRSALSFYSGVTISDSDFFVGLSGVSPDAGPQDNHFCAISSDDDYPTGGQITFDGCRFQSPNGTSDIFDLGGVSTGNQIGELVSYATWAASVIESGCSALTTVPYSDPDRTIRTYRDLVESTSGSTDADFVNEVLAQRRGNWREAYTSRAIINYIRAGMDLAAL